jgi:hypothetical protein
VNKRTAYVAASEQLIYYLKYIKICTMYSNFLHEIGTCILYPRSSDELGRKKTALSATTAAGMPAAKSGFLAVSSG